MWPFKSRAAPPPRSDPLPPLPAGGVTPPRNEMIYRATVPYVGRMDCFIESEALHVRWRSDDGGFFGKSVLTRAAGAMQAAIIAQQKGFQFFSNQARPGGVLQAPGKVSKET